MKKFWMMMAALVTMLSICVSASATTFTRLVKCDDENAEYVDTVNSETKTVKLRCGMMLMVRATATPIISKLLRLRMESRRLPNGLKRAESIRWKTLEQSLLERHIT